MTLSELKELVDFLRAEGVMHYRCGDTELTLGPPTKEAPIEKEPENPLPPKLGKDGLTAEQQRSLYGAVLDPEIDN